MTERTATENDLLEPVIATVTVGCDAATAFEIFTADMGSWWPLADFSLGAGRIVAVEFEQRAGGAVVEVWDDGTRRRWADVLACDPPRSLALAWNPGGFEQGRTPTRVDVSFTAVADDETHVRLVHTGWELLGAEAAETRSSYAEGWLVVLGGYVARSQR
jgi:hypothetical protein